MACGPENFAWKKKNIPREYLHLRRRCQAVTITIVIWYIHQYCESLFCCVWLKCVYLLSVSLSKVSLNWDWIKWLDWARKCQLFAQNSAQGMKKFMSMNSWQNAQPHTRLDSCALSLPFRIVIETSVCVRVNLTHSHWHIPNDQSNKTGANFMNEFVGKKQFEIWCFFYFSGSKLTSIGRPLVSPNFNK